MQWRILESVAARRAAVAAAAGKEGRGAPGATGAASARRAASEQDSRSGLGWAGPGVGGGCGPQAPCSAAACRQWATDATRAALG